MDAKERLKNFSTTRIHGFTLLEDRLADAILKVGVLNKLACHRLRAQGISSPSPV